MAVTMKDIAERAQVSRPVVCAVLGGKSTCRVSEEKRRRILELVKELNFQPNLQAQRLRSGKTRTVGILFASFRDRIIGDVMMELYRRLLQSGYTSIIAIWENTEEIEQAYRNVVRNKVDGIITCDYHPEWIGEKIPVVVYSRQFPETDSITIDYGAAFPKRWNISLHSGTTDSAISDAAAMTGTTPLQRRIAAADFPAHTASTMDWGIRKAAFSESGIFCARKIRRPRSSATMIPSLLPQWLRRSEWD